MPGKRTNPLLTKPRRLAERLIKTANMANAAAELMAENVVGLQDFSRALSRLADEILEDEKRQP